VSPSQAGVELATEAAFREEVGVFRRGQRHRVFPMRVSLGAPAGARVALEAPWHPTTGYDTGLRFDLMCGLVEEWLATAGGPAFGWLTRPGVPEPHDRDLEWYAAATRAFGAYECELLGFRALTRNGWWDVATGRSRTWKRLRL
jgi:hypothetical protein